MKLETILDAMLTVHREMLFEFGRYASAQEIKESKRYRQLHAFRDQILRMDAEKEAHIKLLYEAEEIQDKRIAELEGELDLERRINLEEGE